MGMLRYASNPAEVAQAAGSAVDFAGNNAAAAPQKTVQVEIVHVGPHLARPAPIISEVADGTSQRTPQG
jgi:hypothetical protein